MPRKDKPRTEARCLLYQFVSFAFCVVFMAFVMHIVKETTNMDFCYFTGAAKAPGQLCRLQPQYSCLYMYLVMYVDHFSGHVGTIQVDKDKDFKWGLVMGDNTLVENITSMKFWGKTQSLQNLF